MARKRLISLTNYNDIVYYFFWGALTRHILIDIHVS